MATRTLWATNHSSMNEHEMRFVRKVHTNEIFHAHLAGQLAAKREESLRNLGGRLPPHPTVASSRREKSWIRDTKVRYYDFPIPADDAAKGGETPAAAPASDAPAPAEQQATTTRRRRELPVRGPNPPTYWIPQSRKPARGTLTSSEVGAHTDLYDGLYRQVTLSPNLWSTEGQHALRTLRKHGEGLAPVPHVSVEACSVPGYSSPYRGELAHRPQLVSSEIGAFWHDDKLGKLIADANRRF